MAAAAVTRGRPRALPRALGRLLTTGAAVTTGVAGLLIALAFFAQGGVALEPLTITEVVLLLLGAAVGALAIAAPSRYEAVAPLNGRWPLLALVALAALTALSVMWSIAPAESWLEANRTLAYLAVFGTGLALARLAPGHWSAVLSGLAIACVVICGWALLTKVFPEGLAENELFARLRTPFGYWNAVGLMAALGVPPLLWLAARRHGHALAGALAWPALGLLIVCLLLSFSRGALLALVIGVAAWLVVVPLRLRAAVTLIGACGAAVGVTAWAFAQDGLTKDRLPMHVRADAGHELGVLLMLMSVLLLAAGLAVGFAASTRPPSPQARLMAGRTLLGALAAAVLVGFGALALAPGGIDGQVSKAVKQLTDPAARTPANTPDRLTATSSVRARYWEEAFDIHGAAPWLGTGAGSYGTARKRFRTGDLEVQHAHGYLVQVLADLGRAGLLISLIALWAWLASAARAVGLRRRDRGRPWDAERVGLATLATVVLVFGAHSAIDWTWYIPANAVAALLCAGWVAGRGPLAARQHAEQGGTHDHLPLGARLRAWRPDPYRSAAAAGVLVIAVAAAWTVVQPLRAVHAGDAAIARFQAGALPQAADIARIGAERNPLSVEPLWELAAIEAARNRLPQAADALERAVSLQPANSEAWRRLGRFRLLAGSDPEGALAAFRAAYYLDPRSPESQSDVLQARRQLQAAPAP